MAELLELLKQGVDVFLRLDLHLNEWATALGPWIYVLLFAVVFCETGLVVTPFLPGDTLLFSVGALASLDGSPISLAGVIVLLIVAAILGDALNYAIGSYVGPAVFTSERSRLLHPGHLRRTQEFYARHGRKTIFLARFVPIVRTFAPFVAGIGRMSYPVFAAWNVSGAVTWVVSLTLAGYWFGEIPVVKEHFEAVILVIVALSAAPLVIEFVRGRRAPAAA